MLTAVLPSGNWCFKLKECDRLINFPVDLETVVKNKQLQYVLRFHFNFLNIKVYVK